MRKTFLENIFPSGGGGDAEPAPIAKKSENMKLLAIVLIPVAIGAVIIFGIPKLLKGAFNG